MPVKSKHSDYVNMSDKWQRCIDVCNGQDAIFEAGQLYLPKLIDQTDEQYAKYMHRATFYNATWRTLVGLQGMIFRKPAKIEVPKLVEDMLKNVDLSGTDFRVFVLEVVEEALKTGRVGIFVDYPKAPSAATMADAQRLKLRPSMKKYGAMSIINWKTMTVENETMLSLVVLQESVAKPIDEFTDKADTQYRVLDLTSMVMPDETVKMVYRVRVIEVQKDETTGVEKEVVISEDYPRINGEYLTKIPFQFIGVDDTSWEVDEPPLIDLVDINLAHYRVSADYEHGCHFTGLPTPVIAGYTPAPNSTDVFNIGSMTAWTFPREGTKVSYLEFTGQGLGALERNLEKKEQMMAVLGARMLESQQTGHVEAADTVALRRGGEQSMLASVADAVSIGVCAAIVTFCEFANAATDGVKYQLNKDFFPVPMDSLTLTSYVAAWQNSAISYPTLFNKLQQADLIEPEQTPQSEQAAIKANPPPIPQGGATPGDATPKGPKTASGSTGNAPTQTQLRNGNTGS